MQLAILASLSLGLSISAACDGPHAWLGETRVSTPDDLAKLSGVHEIQGNLSIKCKSCDSLEALSSLRFLEGGLLLEGNDQLIDLSGLEGLSIAGGLSIRHNQNLVDLSQLNHSQPAEISIIGNNSLTEINGFNLPEEAWSITISTNDSLEAISGFRKLKSIDGTLLILSNPRLTDVSGLTQLRSAGKISIGANALLETVEGIAGVETVEGDLLLSELSPCADVTMRDLIGIENIGGQFPTDCSCPDGAWESVEGTCN